MKDDWTWAIHCDRQEVRSCTNYILVTDSHLFQNVTFQDARHKMNHYLVVGCLRRSGPAAHSGYPGKRTRFPIRPPETPDRVEHMFADLQGDTPRPPRREFHCQAYIFSRDLESHRHQDCGAPAEGPTELPGPQPHNQGEAPGGQA